MVKVSHAKCRQCGQSRHRNAKFNLCGRCWRLKKGEVSSGWREIKDRRAARRNGTIHAEADLIVAAAIDQLEEEPTVPRGRAPTLTPEQEQEVINLYTTTDQPVVEIARAYGIPETGPFRILAKNGVSWRRGDSPGRVLPPHIEAMKEVHVAPTPAPAPAPAPRADSKFEIVQPEPPRVMQEALAEAFDKVFPPEPLRTWRVEFSGFREVQARNAREAIAAAEAQGALDVTLVRLA